MSHADLTLEGLRQTIAKQLEIDASEIQNDDNLFMLGLDSVSLMTLVGQWRELGISVEFQDLVEEPTLEDWQRRLKLSPA
ncbi:phosphopantetheine-binding protein [Acinetobacter sp. CFCC 10889]|uniref:phosphopantetheine-binding protein n=1 Tax=Acinetobacter sp. CFCC 10889 TaxID=1775557 RepID=UPI000DCFD7FF|nr:phosphopantetheine-binding protein [Acinetobacter sp. CFCC 10889]